MTRTRHLQQRMNQRGINGRLVELTSQYGVDMGDRIVLTRKHTQALLDGIDGLRKKLLDIHKKGGLVVVECNDRQLTVYRCESYNPNKIHLTSVY